VSLTVPQDIHDHTIVVLLGQQLTGKKFKKQKSTRRHNTSWMFVAFSCKQRCTCPSLDVAEEVCSPVAYRQVMLTIPKRPMDLPLQQCILHPGCLGKIIFRNQQVTLLRDAWRVTRPATNQMQWELPL
jgi:hypothetical protein